MIAAADPNAPAPDIGVRLIPQAIIEMGSAHSLKVRVGRGENLRTLSIPLQVAMNPKKCAEFIAARTVCVIDKEDPLVKELLAEVDALPRIVGTSRLGWTAERDAFVYDGTILYVNTPPARRYEFVAPPNSLVYEAEKALTPKGDRRRQFDAFRELWRRSSIFRLSLALATISPFLEILGAAPIAFHLAGRTGLGKTTMLRLAISAFSDPDSPLTKVDLAKDTTNYADAQLGMLHNFPLLLDETTLTNPDRIAEAAYNIAVGRTKGRLLGADQQYLPADTKSYALVCFLSGEVSIRDDMDRRGSAARFIEIVVQEPLVPAGELPKWYGAASRDYGWFGRDLMKWALKYYFANGKNGRPIQNLYGLFRGRVSSWCQDHPRLVDALALLQVGYYLADSLLCGRLGRHKPRQHVEICAEAEKFAHEIYDLLNKTTRTDTLLTAIAAVTGIGAWIDRGFIPTPILDSVQGEFDILKRSEFASLLKQHGIASGVESRKTHEDGEQRVSQRCYILTAEGKKSLGHRVVDHSPTTDSTTSIPWKSEP